MCLRNATLALGLVWSVTSTNAQNILLIIADDLGTMDVGAYGESETAPPTPSLDFMATNGLLFRNAWALPSCSPTRASILTGRYPFRTGVARNVFGNRVLQLDEVIIPEVVKSVGYSTSLIGKWHLGNDTNGGDDGPNLAGFDHFSGSFTGALPDYFMWPKLVNGVNEQSEEYATTVAVDDAIDWINQQTQPWCCTVSFNAPHDPFHAPPEALHTQDLEGLDPQVSPTPFYKAMIQAMDTEIKRLLLALRDSNQLNNALVIFVGDNGVPDEVAESPCVAGKVKGTPYECGVRVPMIICGPDVVVQAGREIDTVTSVQDIFSTIADFSGANLQELLPQGTLVDGISLMPYIQNTATAPLRETVYTERATIAGNWIAAMRNQRYKLIRFVDDPERPDTLFDLLEDPTEDVDLIEQGNLTADQQENYDALSQSMIDLQATALQADEIRSTP